MFKNGGRRRESKNINVRNACIAFGINGEKIFFQIGFKRHITNTAQGNKPFKNSQKHMVEVGEP